MPKQFFHIGIAVDEIVNIAPNNSTKYPTKYTLRNGSSVTTTGDWVDNVKAVEKIKLNNWREDVAAAQTVRIDEAMARRLESKFDEAIAYIKRKRIRITQKA